MGRVREFQTPFGATLANMFMLGLQVITIRNWLWVVPMDHLISSDDAC